MLGLAYAIVGHLVGDYILQNDYQAAGKKKNSAICALHCSLWTLAVVFTARWFVHWVPLVLFTTHFVQDRWGFVRWWMRKAGQEYFATQLGPWSVIVVDNTLHLIVLCVVAMCLHVG